MQDTLDICLQWFEEHTDKKGISELIDYVFYPKKELGRSTGIVRKNLKIIFYDAGIPLYPKYELIKIDGYLEYGIKIQKLWAYWRIPNVSKDSHYFNQEDNWIKSRIKKHLEKVEIKKRKSINDEYNVIVKRLKEEEHQRIYERYKKRLKEEAVEYLKIRKESNITDGNMEDKIKASDLRANIYEIISGLSKENKKCNEWYLRSDLSRKGYNKGEIYQALKFLKEKETIYEIPYLDWFIAIDYRENDNIGENTLQRNIFKIIKNFSIRFNWKYGIKQSDLFDKLLEKNFSEVEIRSSLNVMREKNIIYKKVYVYWFTKEYEHENIVPKYTIEEDITEEDISEGTEKDIKEGTEKDIKEGTEKDIKEDKGKIEANMENDYSDILEDTEYLTTRWKDFKGTRDKLIQDREKEIVQQKELARKREESINRQKELDSKISGLDKEKERLEKLFESIRLERNGGKKVDEKKG